MADGFGDLAGEVSQLRAEILAILDALERIEILLRRVALSLAIGPGEAG